MSKTKKTNRKRKPINTYYPVCPICGSELIWGGDHDIEEEFDHVDAHKMVTNLTCPNCATFHLVYTPKSLFEKGET